MPAAVYLSMSAILIVATLSLLFGTWLRIIEWL